MNDRVPRICPWFPSWRIHQHLCSQVSKEKKPRTLLIVCNNALGDGLTNGIDLSNFTTTSNADTNIDFLEAVVTNNKQGFEQFESQNFGFQILQGVSVHSDETFALLALSNGNSHFLNKEYQYIVQNIWQIKKACANFFFCKNKTTHSKYNHVIITFLPKVWTNLVGSAACVAMLFVWAKSRAVNKVPNKKSANQLISEVLHAKRCCISRVSLVWWWSGHYRNDL